MSGRNGSKWGPAKAQNGAPETRTHNRRRGALRIVRMRPKRAANGLVEAASAYHSKIRVNPLDRRHLIASAEIRERCRAREHGSPVSMNPVPMTPRSIVQRFSFCKKSLFSTT